MVTKDVLHFSCSKCFSVPFGEAYSAHAAVKITEISHYMYVCSLLAIFMLIGQVPVLSEWLVFLTLDSGVGK